MPALTKEQFVDAINFIDKRSKAMEEINKIFTTEFEDSIFFPYFKYETKMVELLKIIMKDTDEYSWIDYFIYERDFGRDIKLGDVTEEDGTPIPISTPEELYDFLVKEYFND